MSEVRRKKVTRCVCKKKKPVFLSCVGALYIHLISPWAWGMRARRKRHRERGAERGGARPPPSKTNAPRRAGSADPLRGGCENTHPCARSAWRHPPHLPRHKSSLRFRRVDGGHVALVAAQQGLQPLVYQAVRAEKRTPPATRSSTPPSRPVKPRLMRRCTQLGGGMGVATPGTGANALASWTLARTGGLCEAG